MAVVANRRASTVLFSRLRCLDSHRVRFVLAEKDIDYDAIFVEADEFAEDLAEFNPHQSFPCLMDRALAEAGVALYGTNVITEYLDERFPHPPLMPIDPTARAKVRLFIHVAELDLYGPALEIEQSGGKKAEKAKTELKENVLKLAADMDHKPIAQGEEINLADCALAPVLWRLEHYGIQLPPRAKQLRSYMDRLFARRSFQLSIRDRERERFRA